jgi:hypothetical protein
MSNDAASKRLEELQNYMAETHKEYWPIEQEFCLDDIEWLISKLRQSWADLALARAALVEIGKWRCHSCDRGDKARECLAKLDGGEK